MDWFEKLVGFAENSYEETRKSLSVSGDHLLSSVNGKSFRIGTFELPSLTDLRARCLPVKEVTGQSTIEVITADVRQLHSRPECAGALFQVASQFNCLEMVSPNVTPEAGVGRYEFDRTQGPACAIAAGAATIYRNYFVPIAGTYGQTATRQIDGIADVGVALQEATGVPVSSLWAMRNGYALCTREGLDAISAYLSGLDVTQRDDVRSRLRFGLHWDVEVTEARGSSRPLVSQIFCSALPVAYSDVPSRHWEAFARLVLEAAYEATLLAGHLNAQRGGSNKVYLTSLGGGAFGNEDEWIGDAMSRALRLSSDSGLDVKIVSYGKPSRMMTDIADAFA